MEQIVYENGDYVYILDRIHKKDITQVIKELNHWNPDQVRIDTSEQDFLNELHATVCNNCGKKGFNEPYSIGIEQYSKCELCGSSQQI